MIPKADARHNELISQISEFSTEKDILIRTERIDDVIVRSLSILKE
jgi:hypothetical protein